MTNATADKQIAKIAEVMTGGFKPYPPMDRDDKIIMSQVNAMNRMKVLTVHRLKARRMQKDGIVRARNYHGFDVEKMPLPIIE